MFWILSVLFDRLFVPSLKLSPLIALSFTISVVLRILFVLDVSVSALVQYRFMDSQTVICRFLHIYIYIFFFYSICTSVSLPVVLGGVFESFVFLYLGLSCSLLLFWIIYRVGLAGKPLPLVSQAGSPLCCVSAFIVLQHLRCPV